MCRRSSFERAFGNVPGALGVVAWPQGVIALPAASRRAPSQEVVASRSPSHSGNRKLAQGRASHPDHDLPSGVTCFQVAHRLGGLTQRVGPVDDRRDLAGFDEVFDDLQVLLAPFRQERQQPLAYER